MLKLAALLLAFTVAAPVTGTAAEPETPNARVLNLGGPRVRPHDERSATALLEGLRRSDTLRVIVDEIERRDVIVYLEMQPLLRRSLAGSLTWLTFTPSFRYVRISINPALAMDAQIATLGHELRHALEVARAPSVVSATTLAAYYAKNGLSMPSHDNGWDTLAARQTGEQVRRELAGGRASRSTESVQGFNLQDWHVVYRRTRGMLPP